VTVVILHAQVSKTFL